MKIENAIKEAFHNVENQILKKSADEGWNNPCGSTALLLIINKLTDEIMLANLVKYFF